MHRDDAGKYGIGKQKSAELLKVFTERGGGAILFSSARLLANKNAYIQ